MYQRTMEQELNELALWLWGVDRRIPLQIMRFMPLGNADARSEPTIFEAEQLCRKLSGILEHVYLFNSPGTRLLDTHCPSCHEVVVTRDFFGPMGARVTQIQADAHFRCNKCATQSDLKGPANRPAFREHGFNGGYPFTRGLEMIEAVMLAIGADDTKDVVAAWETNISTDGMAKLHEEVATISGYLRLVNRLGSLCGRERQAQKLSDYLGNVSSDIAKKAAMVTDRPRVCYVMGKPLFCLNPGRFENRLVEQAGGISVNASLDISGRPGSVISAQTMRDMNPDIIFTSSFLSHPVHDTIEDCRRQQLTINAVRDNRIYTHPFPVIDFGSPRWILGLMHIANMLHPKIFHYNIKKEAIDFYRRFYQCDFNASQLNLSFAKPSAVWRREVETTGA